MAKFIAPYITEVEYRCPCCDAFPPDFDPGDILAPYQILFDGFAEIRREWGGPLRISSGYRCPMRNAFVGGRVLSAHMFGLALDIDVDSVDEVARLDRIIDSLYPEFRRGTYANSERSFIHIDVAYFIFPRASESWIEGLRWTG